MSIGAAGAVGAALISTLLVWVTLIAFQELYTPAYRPTVFGLAALWGLSVAQAAVTALAVQGAARALQPSNRVLVVGAAAGWASAGLLAAGAVLSFLAALRRQEPSLLTLFAPVLLGVWMLCLVAADWRLRRLPGWLRIVGAFVGGALMILPAVPILRLAAALGPVWWLGLAWALARQARRSTPG